MYRKFWIAFLLLLAPVLTDVRAETPLLTRMPAVGQKHIVFVFAGDLWIVPKDGGAATRLTTGVGVETTPLISPDGQTVAFTGEYDGNVDVYLVPIKGGTPRRLTYHPDTDTVAGWTPDGRNVLFVSGRDSESGRTARLYTMATDGVFPTPLPLPMAFEGSYSSDAGKIAYVPLPRAFNAWKRYRGGRATPIWIADLSDSSVEKLPREDSNDFNPMWIGTKIYFLSDRSGPVTLYAHDTVSKKTTKVIENSGFDIKSASAGADEIVYEQFGSINVLDLKTGASKRVNITIDGDMPSVRPGFRKVGDNILNAAISPTGARAVFEARGEILTVPAEKGDVRNMTNTTGIAERDPAWSPDGKHIAYFSEESGEYALHIRPQNGLGEVRKINLGNPPSFFYSPAWSPDGTKIAYSDKRNNIWYVDVEKGAPVKVDYLDLGVSGYRWSPDSRRLVYAKQLQSWFNAVFVYTLADGKSVQITDGLSDAVSPTFDRSGKYIVFTASTNIGPQLSGFDMSAYAHRPTRNAYIVVLKKDQPSPLAPESDEDKGPDAKDAKKDNGDGKPNGEEKKDEKKKETPNVEIDFDGIGQRILALPIPARAFVDVQPGKEGTIYFAESAVDPGPDGPSLVLSKFDLEKRKFEKVLHSISGFVVSRDGEKLLYRQQNDWFIASLSQPIKPGEGKIKTDAMEAYIDPRAEWRQMYHEAWRIERDFFYDPNYHGLDLKAAEKKYAPFLDGLAHRADLNYLFNEMLGELTIGHLYVTGGDVPRAKRTPGGLLGADYKIENGRYRFAKVYNGENWNPQLSAPLTQPGVNVTAGEYLLAVNGRPLTSTDNLYGVFEGTAGKQVVLKVGSNPDGTNSREVTVVPTADEDGLRNLDWIEGNRRTVDRLSGGQLAYVWLPNTAQGGYVNFNRYFFAQIDRHGAVVDERFNGGGHAADYIVDYLRKPLMSYWAIRDGRTFRQPFGTMPGPKAMLVNEFAGSGGDYMPWMFRRLNIGPLIGKRTWGGLVGIGGYPQLVDGGGVTAPHFAFFSPEGKWEIENHGVAPDIEIDMDPKLWRQGRDSQLEKAVEWLMGELKKNPVKETPIPAYPNYHKGK